MTKVQKENIISSEDTIKSVSSFINPNSIVILGASAKPGSSARNIIKNLKQNEYTGEIYLLGRNSGDIDGLEIKTSISQLPKGIDVGILAIPASSVYDTIVELKTIDVKTVVCMSSGFAELGEEGIALQNKIGDFACKNNIRLIGPNCIGYFNFVNDFHLSIIDIPKQATFDKNSKGIAVVTQSGGMGIYIGQAFGSRGVPTSYSVTIGNQADIEIADLIEFFVQDEYTSTIAIYAEEIKNPEKLLDAVQKANDAKKNIVLMHSGRSEASRSITQSHTGSLTGDYKLMQTKLVNAGVAMVDSLEELINLSELLLRFPDPIQGEVGLVTHSGALCAIVSDHFEDHGLTMSSLSQDAQNKLKEALPEYLPARNPVDLGIEASKNPSLVGLGVDALCSEPKLGSTLTILPIDQSLDIKLKYLGGFIESTKKNPRKPAIYVALDDSGQLESEFMDLVKKEGVVLGKTLESAIRTLSNLNKLCINRNKQKREIENVEIKSLADLSGTVPEYKSKEILKSLDIPTPRGALATTPDEAVKIANEISYPVVLKAQSSQLAHKTDAGGVMLNIKSDEELKEAFTKMSESIKTSKGITLDGILIEPMEKLGAEIVIGARRDPQWGAVVLVGLGGIWIEILKDVCLITPDLGEEAIVEAISSLKSAALLKGARGSEAVDISAIAKTVIKIADLISSNDNIAEVEINPLIAKPDGVVALDALMILED